ncbi:MAG: MarC family protein [Polyangiaceae bacterium]
MERSSEEKDNVREVLTYWALVLISVLGVANPVRLSASLALMGEGLAEEARRVVIRRACLLAAALLLAGAWIGNHIVLYVGIKTGGFRAACSLFVLVLCLGEVLRNQPLTPPGAATEPKTLAQELALSGLAAAPVLGTVVIYSGETHELWRREVTLCAVCVAVGICFVLLRLGPRLLEHFGERGMRWLGHVLRLTAAGWAVDFFSIGVRDLLPLITSTPPAQ